MLVKHLLNDYRESSSKSLRELAKELEWDLHRLNSILYQNQSAKLTPKEFADIHRVTGIDYEELVTLDG